MGNVNKNILLAIFLVSLLISKNTIALLVDSISIIEFQENAPAITIPMQSKSLKDPSIQKNDWFFEWEITEELKASIVSTTLAFSDIDTTEETLLYTQSAHTGIELVEDSLQTNSKSISFKPTTLKGKIFLNKPLDYENCKILIKTKGSNKTADYYFFIHAESMPDALIQHFSEKYKPSANYIRVSSRTTKALTKKPPRTPPVLVVTPLKSGEILPIIVQGNIGQPAILTGSLHNQFAWDFWKRPLHPVPGLLQREIPPELTIAYKLPEKIYTRFQKDALHLYKQQQEATQPQNYVEYDYCEWPDLFLQLEDKIRKSVDVFTIQQGNYSHWVLETICEAHQDKELSQTQKILLDFCQEKRLLPQMLWFYSLYFSPSKQTIIPDAAITKTSTNHKTRYFLHKDHQETLTSSDDKYFDLYDFEGTSAKLITRLSDILVRATPTKKDKFKHHINFIRNLFNLLNEEALEKKEICLTALHNTCKRACHPPLYHSWDTRTQTNLAKYEINDLITEMLMSPYIISSHHMRVLRKIGNEWCVHLQKGLTNIALKWENQRLKKHLARPPKKKFITNTFQEYVKYIKENFIPESVEVSTARHLPSLKEEEFKRALRNAENPSKLLDELWNLLANELRGHFEPNHDFQEFISYIMVAIIHQGDSKLVDSYIDQSNLKHHLKYILKNTKEALPARSNLNPKYLAIADDYEHLIQQNCDKRNFLQLLLQNSIISYYFNLIAIALTELENSHIINYNNGLDSLNNTLCHLKNIITTDLNPQRPFPLWVSQLSTIANTLYQITHWINHIDREFQFNPILNMEALAISSQIINQEMLVHSNPLFNSDHVTDSLRDLNELLDNTYQRLHNSRSQIIEKSALNPLAALCDYISKNGQHSNFGHLHYILKFIKAAVDLKKREAFAEKREERYWPVDQQLAKQKLHSPVLAKIVISLPQKLLGKLKSFSEAIFWKKLQWPCKDWSWQGWERPVLEWSKPDIVHFVNASGWLKLYDNFTHPLSLGREQHSNKGVETIPTCNSMVVTPKTINHIQFLTEMAIALCIQTTTESLSNTDDDNKRHLQHIESVWQKLIADSPDPTGACPVTGKLKAHYSTTFNYRNHFHNLSRADHYQYEHSNKKQLYPSDIVKLLIDATVRQHKIKERLFEVIDSASSDAWKAVITNYFSNYDLDLVEAPNLRAFDPSDVTKPELTTFFSGYKLLRECFLAVATCDYVKSTTLHTFEENSFVVNILSLPSIPAPEIEDARFTWLASPTTLEPTQSRLRRWVMTPLTECRLPWHTLVSATKTALLPNRYNQVLFELSSKLFSDYVNATGTHLGHLMTQAKNQHVPDTLDEQIKKIQRPESFIKLQEIYSEYRNNMSSPVKREKVLLKMKAVLSRGGLDYYWEKIANMVRHTVDWSAEQDKIVLPVYLTWSILTGLYIQDGNLILDQTHQLETRASDLANSTRSAETVMALEAAAGINTTLPRIINDAGTFNPLASVTQWANQSHAIHTELHQISEENHGSFGANANGIIRLNIGSTTLATVTGLIQSAGWFGDQLSIMEKTLRLEKLGLITGTLPALHCEHYLKMETGAKSIYKQTCGCQCRTDGQLSQKACTDSCYDTWNRVHDAVSCIASYPNRLTEACFSKCCDLNQSPCARNSASAIAYCCCGGVCLSPFEAAIGYNPHQYIEAVIGRMVGAAGRSIGTGTRTVPYNTFKETLNTCVEDSNYAKFGRFAALFLDGVIAVGEISKFIVQSNAEEKHDSSSRAISKIYSPERFNAADLSCIQKFYGTQPACYLSKGQDITPIPYRSCDKTMSCLCCGLGSLGLGYSVQQAVLGIDNVFCKPLKKGIKAFNRSGWAAGRNAYDQELKTVDISDRTVKEKIPANSSIFCFSKSSRLAGSKRASHPGNNTQTTLGNLKNGVTGPWNRSQIKSGDPAKMTFAGGVDAVEGFVVDAGNSQQSHLNMLNTPPPARQTGLKMVEASFYSALRQSKNPADQYLKIMKEKIGLCASGGLIQLAEFIDAHLMLEEQNLMKDWRNAKKHLTSHQAHHQFLAWQLKERTQGLIQIHHNPCRNENLHSINSHGDLEPLSITQTLSQTRADQAEVEKRISSLSNINLRKRSTLVEVFPLLLQLDQYKGGFMSYFMAQPAVKVLSGNTKPHQD
ncbi:hypothetical protein [Endozoicomonas sp. Mp262]|uniref:hypothetical protein n=1 Tax=Endozoicomonas sp. Mp262 TaxID=2919499 RepID=UPI0021D8D698